jgi:methyl-accepting chemotaxis protein
MFKTIQSKLAACFAGLTALLIGMCVFSYVEMSSMQAQFTELVEGNANRAKIANQVLDAVNGRAVETRNLVVAHDASHKQHAQERVATHHAALSDALQRLKSAAEKDGAAPQELGMIAKIAEVELRYGPVALSIVKQAMEGEAEAAVKLLNDACLPLLGQLLAATHEHLTFLELDAKAEVTSEAKSFANATLLLLLAAGLAAMGSGLLAYVVPKNIKAQLGAEPDELNEAMKKIAVGQLGPVNGADQAPPNSLLAAVGQMQRELANMVSQVRNTSDSIATGSSQIATGNADLSQRTEEQASNLQETSASMMEIRSTVERNADTARQATHLASSASAAAQEGGQVMRQVVDTMQDIASSSKKVTDIIAVIDGIAFQTNILALNAAVEAARAGEQGRGFAVVAGEVRTLAQRSAEAAKEIKSLIGASTGSVDNGRRLVENAGTAIEDIVAQVRKVADFIAEISSSAAEQTTTIGQVSDAVGLLDQVTQQNAALVEESAAAAESLKHQAASLADLVNRFRLAD